MRQIMVGLSEYDRIYRKGSEIYIQSCLYLGFVSKNFFVF